MKKPLLLLLSFISIPLLSQKQINIEIDLAKEPVQFDHYWKSTGFTPASAVHLPTMQLTLDQLSSQCGEGVKYVRPHYLLNLVGTRGLGTENTEYNWEKLDFVIDYFVENDLIPFFEIMGHPSTLWEAPNQVYDPYFQGQKSDSERYFNDFEDDTQLKAWKDLVKAMALHFIDRYGKEEVRSWYFETWNEPNLRHFWTFGLPGFLNYYDACSEGLKEADPELVFGGPGTAGAPGNDTFKKLLEHCEKGTNYFTGEEGVRIDFISYHIKARARFMVMNELEVIEYIENNHPAFKNIPLINNEADPIAGWGQKFFWRPGPWYASFVVNSIDLHNKFVIDEKDIKYGLLSNDNGFMGDFYRRTHFARFMKDNDDQLSQSEGFYLIKKPVYSVMGLLTLMGNERYHVDLENLGKNYGLIPTKNENGDIILAIYNSPLIEISYKRPVMKEREYVDDLIYKHSDVNFNINLKEIPAGKYKLIHYRLDEEHTNPFAVWMENGAPEFPTRQEYLRMASKQEPQILGVPTDLEINTTNTEIEIEMPAPSVSFIVLAKQNETPPSAPYGLTFKEYTGLNGEKMIMIKWKDVDNSHLLTYDLHFKAEDEDEFSKINPSYLRDKSYVHLLENGKESGEYKVKAIDFWGRESEFSGILKIDE